MKQALTAYKEAQDSTPEAAFERLLATYDVAIAAAIHKNRDHALHAITLLEKTIDSGANPEMALSLQGIYAECRNALEDEKWAQFAEMIERLKGLWTAKFRLDQATVQK